MTVLVTGHSGFIGRNLVEQLREAKAEVKEYSRNEGFDILDQALIIRQSKQVDILYHLAAYAKPAESLENPSLALRINLEGTFNVLEACRRNEFTLVYPSTCEIYGDSTDPITEEHPINPPNPYAASKAAADRLCFSYAKAYGLRIVIERLFNPYGPYQQLEKIMPTFYFQAIRGEPITVYGDGKDTRDYTYVQDVVRALLLGGDLKGGDVVNICTGKKSTILDIANLVKKATNSKSEIMLRGYPRLFGGIKNQVGSNMKAISELGWRPQVDLEEGIRRTIGWLSNAYPSK